MTTLLPGMPEITVSSLVRRAHNASNCPHNGQCLTEKQMIEALHDYLAVFQAQAHQAGMKEGLERALEVVKRKLEGSYGNKKDDVSNGIFEAIETIESGLKTL